MALWKWTLLPIHSTWRISMFFLSLYILFNDTHPAISNAVSSKYLSFWNYAQFISTHSFYISNSTKPWEQFIYINKPRTSVSVTYVWNNDSCRGPSDTLSPSKLYISGLSLTNTHCAIYQYCKVTSCYFCLLRTAQRTFAYSVRATVNSA